MNEKFFDLARQKQDKMINGALEVFAKNGYRHAATDEMVKVAGVSKGLWFHYFGSKEGIYVFTYDYSVKYMLLELSAAVDGNGSDYFELVRQIEQARARVGRTYPYMSYFLREAEYEEEPAIVEKTAEARQLYHERMESFFRNVEIESVPDRTKRERIKKLLACSLEGLLHERQRSGADAETVYREARLYIELMRELTAKGSRKE